MNQKVPKHIVDKNGKRTTVYVNPYEVDKSKKRSVSQPAQSLSQEDELRKHYDDLFDSLVAKAQLDLGSLPLDNAGMSLRDKWDSMIDALSNGSRLTQEEALTKRLGLNFGRLRAGPYLVWEDDTDDIEDMKLISSLDVPVWNEDRKALIVVHTRNGSGNRECYCETDDKHDEGCLFVINSEMQSHPDYVKDQDNSFDGTYADFAFEIDNTTARQLIIDDDIASKHIRASVALEAFERGDKSIVDLLPPNPKRQEAVEELDRQISELGSSIRVKLSSGQECAVNNDLVQVYDDVCDFLEGGGRGEEPQESYITSVVSKTFKNIFSGNAHAREIMKPMNDLKSVQEAEGLVKTHDYIDAELQKDNLPVELRTALEYSAKSYDIASAPKKFDDYKARFEKSFGDFKRDRDLIREAGKNADKMEELKRTREDIINSLKVPGDFSLSSLDL